MKNTRRHYSREYKIRVIEKSYEVENISDLADDLGIGSDLIYRWRREYAKEKELSFPGEGNVALTEEQKEIARLKKELADAKLEAEILKKAIGIFSKNGGKYSDL